MNGACCQNCGATGKPIEKRNIYLASSTKVMAFCSNECRAKKMIELREQDASDWLYERIPSTYRRTDAKQLPDQEASKLVLDFDPDEPCCLYAYGPTGAGKTRSLILRLRRFVSGGESAIYIRGKQFGDEVVERTRPGGIGGFKKWFVELAKVEILGIDEVDKISFSDRVRSEFFELVECRTSDQRPTLFVAQCNLDRLAEKISGPKKSRDGREEAAGIVRRIRENSLPVHFERVEPANVLPMEVAQ